MNQRKIVRPLSVMVLACLALTSCSKEKSAEIEYFPFRSENRMYGMLSADGKILFEDEFKKAPTVVRDGRFFVKNSDGLWEMYTASEHPEKVGSEYVYATAFRNGRALVAEKDKPVTIIDVDGKVVKKLDRSGERKVAEVQRFGRDGYAIFKTIDDKFGLIDKDGNCTVKPVYRRFLRVGDDVFMGVDDKVDNLASDEKVPVISGTGKVLCELSLDNVEKLASWVERTGQFSDGKFPVERLIGGKRCWSIIDLNGEELCSTFNERIESIGQIKGDLFTFEEDGKWGLMNVKGKTLIGAKYDGLFLDTDNRLIAGFSDSVYSRRCKLIDINDNQIGEVTFKDMMPFSWIDGKHAFIEKGNKDFAFIDINGKELETILPEDMKIRPRDWEGDDVVRCGIY